MIWIPEWSSDGFLNESFFLYFGESAVRRVLYFTGPNYLNALLLS
jgi:hypothetical protein